MVLLNIKMPTSCADCEMKNFNLVKGHFCRVTSDSIEQYVVKKGFHPSCKIKERFTSEELLALQALCRGCSSNPRITGATFVKAIGTSSEEKISYYDALKVVSKMINKELYEEALAESINAYIGWYTGGRHEACDALNDSSRKLIVAYKNHFQNPLGYKIHKGIISLDTEIFNNFCIDFLFEGTPKNIETVKKAEKEFKEKFSNPEILFDVFEKINGQVVAWS